MEFELSGHAKRTILERNINHKWILLALTNPIDILADKHDAMLEHRLAVIADNEDRVLRVIINKSVIPVRIVTAYFDRGLRDKYETSHR